MHAIVAYIPWIALILAILALVWIFLKVRKAKKTAPAT